MGEVPIRDFMAYDIGRYYWSAAIMAILGDTGIVALRVATSVFQAIALFIGLMLLTRPSPKSNLLFWLLAIITLMVWMFPQFRMFDMSLPIILIGALSFLVYRPSSRRYFVAGLTLGIIAVFGRNHGLYGVVGSLCVIFYISGRREDGPPLIKALTTWGLGIVTGYLPVLIFLTIVPGFASAYWQSILLLFEIKATNYPLPIPWPWLIPFGKVTVFHAICGVLEGVFFIAIVAFGLLGIVWVIRDKFQGKPVPPVLLASVFLALPYAHYAYSRPDISHLTSGIPPFLIGVLALLINQPAKVKWPLAALLCGASLLLMLPAHPGLLCHSQPCIEINVAGDKLIVDRSTARNVATFRTLAEQFAPDGRTFIAAPFWPGAYAALERKSPVWEIYMLFPRGIAFQQAEIERIKVANPGFAVILDAALDGREDLRFRNTHPMIEQYIRENFDRLDVNVGNPTVQIYTRKPVTQ